MKTFALAATFHYPLSTFSTPDLDCFQLIDFSYDYFVL